MDENIKQLLGDLNEATYAHLEATRELGKASTEWELACAKRDAAYAAVDRAGDRYLEARRSLEAALTPPAGEEG